MVALTYRHETRGHVDRSQPISFSFNGQPCLGYKGDTLASALLANDIQIIGRSLKYNRPRSINGVGWDDTNSFVRLEEGEDHRVVLATQIDLCEGLSATSLAPWPTPSLIDRIRNKEQKRPDLSVARHQLIRPDFNNQAIVEHCDILVIGSGPAGLAAAQAASAPGLRTIMVEADSEPGGALLWCHSIINNLPSDKWLAQTLANLKAAPDTHIHTRSQAIGIDEQGRVIVLSILNGTASANGQTTPQQFLVRKINANQVILATGADERLLPFPSNDTPGIMRASALAAYHTRYGIACKEAAIVVVSNNDDGHAMACQLHDLGFDIAAVVDARTDMTSATVAPLCDRGIDLIGGHAVTEVIGDDHVESITLRRLVDGNLGSEKMLLDCQFLAITGGWNPRLEFLSAIGGSCQYDETFNSIVPDQHPGISAIVGSALGDTSLSHALKSGSAAAVACIQSIAPDADIVATDYACPAGLSNRQAVALWEVPQSGIVGRPRQWVDLRAEVTTQAIHKAKSKKDASNDPCFIGLLEDVQMQSTKSNISMDLVMTRIDPDVPPPRRRLPTHGWHVSKGAAFRLSNQWLRPALYPKQDISHEEAISEEVWAGRNSVTLHDLSAVGKIEVTGTDARRFLDHLFTCNVQTLDVGMTRYGMLLDESGTVIDHGVIACLRQDHFLINTSPSTGETVRDWMRSWHASDMADQKLHITQVSHQWACLLLTGPRSRQVLLELDRDIDISTTAMPYLAAQTGTLCGIPICLMRTGFTGDLTFEIHVEADQALNLWEALMKAGKNYGIRPIGEDALNRLAAEKGRPDMAVIAEQSLAPADISPSGAFKAKKADFIGKKALSRPTPSGAKGLQLVALRSDDSQAEVPLDGTISEASSDGQSETARQGHLLTSFFSRTLNQTVALALIENGHSKIGDIVQVKSGSITLPMRISRPTIFDPNGRKRHA